MEPADEQLNLETGIICWRLPVTNFENLNCPELQKYEAEAEFINKIAEY